VYTCGIQSGSEKTLSFCNRYSDVNSTFEIFQEIKRNRPDLFMFGHMIIGLPNEEREDLMQSINFIRFSSVDFWTCFKYSMNDNSEFGHMELQWDEANIDNNWSFFRNETRKVISYFMEDDFKRIYLANSIDSEFVDVDFSN
jgi:tRNA A37 methylthiotransferase MiaB